MKKNITFTIIILLSASMTSLCFGGEKISSQQKKKLTNLLQSIEKKAKEAKPRKHEIAVPVATAGVRGSEATKSGQFAVVWPGLTISPLSALSANLKHDAAEETTAKELRAQIEEFIRTFPEFKDEPLLKDALEVLK